MKLSYTESYMLASVSRKHKEGLLPENDDEKKALEGLFGKGLVRSKGDRWHLSVYGTVELVRIAERAILGRAQ